MLPPSRRRATAGPVIGLVAFLLLPAAALAHAELVTADPGPNASLVEPPAALRMTFSEAIDPSSATLELLDAALRPIPAVGDAQIDDIGTGVTVDLPPLDPGIYTVSYQVLSAVDGHATAGRFSFAVDPSGAQAPPTATPTTSSPSVDAWSIGARWIALAAALIALGSLILWWASARGALAGGGLGVDDRPPWRVVAAAAAASFAGLWLYLVLAARPLADMDAGGGAIVLSLDPATPFGWTPFALAARVALVASLLAVLTSVAFATRRRLPHGSAVAAWTAACLALALAGMSAAGHASSLGGPVNALIDWIHLVAAAAWLGGLPAAFALAHRAAPAVGSLRAPLGSILRRHGRVALVAGPVVILTGLANSPLVMGSSRELVASPHGNLLLGKALLASIALGIGAANHLLLRHRGRGNLVLLLGAELLVAALAVGAAATMVTIQPGAARQPTLTGSLVNPAHYFGEAGPSRVHVAVNLPSPGDQSYQVIVRDVATGAPHPDVQKVFIGFTPPVGSGLAAERAELERRSPDGVYGIHGVYTPVAGEWRLEVIVRRAGARDETVAFDLPITEGSAPIQAPTPDAGLGVPVPLAMLWDVLPAGLLGWLPGLVVLLGVIALSRGRIAAGPSAPAKMVVLALATVALLAAGSRTVVEVANRPTAAGMAAFQSDPDQGSAESGERIYLANCASCHGIEGGGNGPVRTLPPAGGLRSAVAMMSDAELSYRIANGLAGTPMPAFAASLTAQERRDLVIYLRERWDVP